MPGLYVRDTDGVSRKYRELHETQSGVDRKLREMYARDSGGINRRIFSAAPKWELSHIWEASPSKYSLYSDEKHASSTYTLKSENYLTVNGAYIDTYVADPFGAGSEKLLEFIWHISDENGNIQTANSFYMEIGDRYMHKPLYYTHAVHAKTVRCEFIWKNYGRDGTYMNLYLYTNEYGKVYVHEE